MTTASPARPMARYWNSWRGLPKSALYLLVGLPVASVGFGVTLGLIVGAVGTFWTFVFGLAFLVGALYVARGFGTADVALLTWVGRTPIARPEWMDAQARSGVAGWLRALLANGHYWLYLLHTMIVDFVLKVVSWSILVLWLSIAFGGLTAWIWQLAFAGTDFTISTWGFASLPGLPLDGTILDVVLSAIIGLVALVTLPLVAHVLVTMHWAVARGMLGSFRSDVLRRQVADLSESRGAAISAEGHSLRRLERDIHDGPQQRLVRLQMDLAAADRQLDANPEKARTLISEAMQQSREALEELRALSRGFAPPILLDRGLIAALQSSAVRSSIPTSIIDELPAQIELPQEIERNAYFVASEALANAIKHSGATELRVTVALRRLPESDVTWLDVIVADDGSGGAVPVAGHGLAGLEERLRGLGGTLEVVSPLGGPTVVSAHLPLTYALPGSRS